MTQINRRRFFLAVALARRLDGGAADFWNQKPIAEWSPEEVQQLLTASPWAKRVRVTISVLHQGKESAETPSDVAPAAQRCSDTKNGPVELNRGDRSTCASGQSTRVSNSEKLTQIFTGSVLWESALPVRQVIKSILPDRFLDQYVLSVRGLPIGEGISTKGELIASEVAIESIRLASSLTVQNWMRRRPPVAAQTAQMAGNALLLGFPHGALHLAAADDVVEFKTVIKAATVATKFKLPTMIFRGALAL